jgi:hypothetical protein
VFDVGPLSPPHLPPHAHADALSFVLWADGLLLITDPGTYAYTGPWRNSFRATAAHNTVEVDDEDQCQLWADFRIAYPPRVRAEPLRRYGDVVVASGAHDGYRRLADPVDHHRTLVWCRGGVIVVDVLHARRSHSIRSRLHLAPGAVGDGLRRVGPIVIRALGTGGKVHRADGYYAPYIGRRVRADVVMDERIVDPAVPFGWSLLREGWRVTSLDPSRLVLAGPEGRVTIPLGFH